MYLCTSRRKAICQIAQKCSCQKSGIYTQLMISPLRISNILVPKSNLLNISLTKMTPVSSNTAFSKDLDEIAVLSDRNYSSSSGNTPETEKLELRKSEGSEATKLSNKDKLKRAVKDYGATVIIFHVTISLMSLGISYLVISSGVDVASLLDKLGLNSKSDIATGASTFVVAYAVHKVFAPVRISITLGATPFIVRYLRRVGFLKPPKS